MEVFVDATRVDFAPAAESTVEEMLREVQQHHCPPGRIVVGIRCDGREVAPGAMASTLRQNAGEMQRIDVVTGTAEELVIDALQQATRSLDDSEDASRRAADLLVEGQTREGIQLLGECSQVWKQVHDALSRSIEMLNVDVASLEVRDLSFQQAIERPRDVLQQIKQALQAQDYVTLADVLQYEFIEAAELWRVLIATILRRAERAQGPAE